MQESEWKSAFDKWFRICELLAEAVKTGKRSSKEAQSAHGMMFDRSCSYCDEWGDGGCAHDDDWEYNPGDQCPLERKRMCSDCPDRRFRFWKLHYALKDGRPHRVKHAHAHAVAILNAITDTKEEVTGRSVNDYLRDNGRGD